MPPDRPVVFDPFGWAARLISARWLHRLIRLSAVAIFAVFVARRVRQYDDFLLKPLWLVETLVYLVLAAAFMMRLDPLDRSRGMREVLVPVVGGLFPFALLTSLPHPAVWTDTALRHDVLWWMTVATTFTVWGMWVMRRAFSFTVEAREHVTRGPNRSIRHPIYAGELLTAAVVMLWRFSATNLALLAAFTVIQLLRSRWEEQKLARAFPTYAGWAGTVWWFWRFTCSRS